MVFLQSIINKLKQTKLRSDNSLTTSSKWIDYKKSQFKKLPRIDRFGFEECHKMQLKIVLVRSDYRIDGVRQEDSHQE